MRHLRINSPKGFTLVEVLVISPIIILFIGAFIALAVGLTGDSLKLRERNAATYDVQAALNTMEASVLQATSILDKTDSPLPFPQGTPESGTASLGFTNTNGTNPDSLILSSPTTTRRQTDPARSIIYLGSGTCNNKNPLYTYTTVFFVDTNTNTLYKRTLVPATYACDKPWQRNSCSANDVAGNPAVCKAQDEKLLDNVASMDVQYFTNAAATTALADTDAKKATSVSITINLTKQVGGSTVAYSSSARTTSLNVQTSEADAQPVTPTPITWQRNTATPYLTTFSWDQVGSATGYNIKYRLGSGTWVNGPQNQSPSNATYSITATARKQNVDIQVDVITAQGVFTYGTSYTTIPNWNDCTMPSPSGWQNFDAVGTGYNEAGYTKTSTQMVGLKGLVKAGPVGYVAANTNYVCTLPVGFRPVSRQIFQVTSWSASSTNSRGWGRVDVDIDGTVNVISGNNTFVGLDGIIFATSGTPMSVNWTNATFQNGWYYSTYGDDYGTPRYGVDSLGRVLFEGLAAPGSVNVNMLGNLAASARPVLPLHLPADAGTGGPIGMVNIYNDGQFNARQIANYRATQFIYYPSTFNSWRTLAYQNSWHDYGGGWSTGQCALGSDDIVIVKGLISGGNVTYPATITNLASAVGGSCGTTNTGGTLLMATPISPDYPGSVDIAPSGIVTVVNGSAGWTSLDGMHFIAN